MLTEYQTSRRDQLAERAAGLWPWKPAAITHIADSGNSVWLVEAGGQRRVLRLTNPEYRSLAECEAELEFVRHLDACGVRVGVPLTSIGGAYVERVEFDGAVVLASMFTFVDGQLATRDSGLWTPALLGAWGHTLGAMHRAARMYRPALAARRWNWDREVFLARALELIPTDESDVLAEFHELMATLAGHPKTEATYGMVHGDFAPQNFRYRGDGAIGVFDFGNCCMHWYASDIAVGLSTLRGLPRAQRNSERALMVEAYLQVCPDADLSMLPTFLRLRILYVYLSRLMKFGPNPTDPERAVLANLRHAVQQRYDWDTAP